MEKLSFEEIREIIIQKCIEKEACGSQNTPYDEEFGKLMNSKNEADFWKIICINGSWAVSHNVISVEILEQYDANILNNHNIFIEKKECVIDESVLSINLSGTVTDNYGTVTYNSGTVTRNYGTVTRNSGTVTYNYGTVTRNSGTVTDNYGTVTRNYGTVTRNYGTVTDNYGTAVVIERQNNRIYMKKGEFEIIYFD